jgi:hypothetical protein
MRHLPFPRSAALALAALAALALGCGARPGQGGAFSLKLLVDGALPTSIAAFQVEMLSHGSSYDCQAIETTCLNAQLKSNQLVTLTDSSNGHEAPALVFPVQAGGGNQDVIVSVVVGTNYKLVIEALSTDPTQSKDAPMLVGTSCTAMPDGIASGSNNRQLTEPMKLYSPPMPCDPSWK